MLSSAASSGSGTPSNPASVATRSVRHTSASVREPAATWPGHASTSGSRCPPSQMCDL